MFVDALRKAGAQVDHCFVVFFYDIFPESPDLMKELGIELHYLATWWDILVATKEMGHFDKKTLVEVESFLDDPARWSAAHGGELGPDQQGLKRTTVYMTMGAAQWAAPFLIRLSSQFTTPEAGSNDEAPRDVVADHHQARTILMS
jgi:hypothetical protein